MEHRVDKGSESCLEVFVCRCSRGDRKARGPRTFWISELEEVYEVLGRDGREAAVGIVCRARMSRVL